MSSVNKCIILGNVGSIGEIKNFTSGDSLINISVATTETYKSKSDLSKTTEITEWHRIVLRNNLANYAFRYLKKGSKVYIEGFLRTRKWTDTGGYNRSTTEIFALKVENLSGQSLNNPQNIPISMSPTECGYQDTLSNNDDRTYPINEYEDFMQGEDLEYRQF